MRRGIGYLDYISGHLALEFCHKIISPILVLCCSDISALLISPLYSTFLYTSLSSAILLYHSQFSSLLLYTSLHPSTLIYTYYIFFHTRMHSLPCVKVVDELPHLWDQFQKLLEPNVVNHLALVPRRKKQRGFYTGKERM